jgi:hypothetical protein
MIVSIHQPNYLPWLGFFDKIIQSDVFVVFDNVQFPRGKSHFGHRNLIKTGSGDGKKYLTVPLIGKSQMKNFNEIEINHNGWEDTHLNLLSENYRKAAYYDVYFDQVADILHTSHTTLSDLSVDLLKYFIDELQIDTEIVLSSELCDDNVEGAARIQHILSKLNATKYISGSGPGSMRYIDEQEFRDNNIELIWQEYLHPTYNQLNGEFIPYMCILDLLFNEGDNSRVILRA